MDQSILHACLNLTESLYSNFNGMNTMTVLVMLTCICLL